MKLRDGQLTREQIKWCIDNIPAFSKSYHQASAAEADTAAYRARYQEQLEAQKAS